MSEYFLKSERLGFRLWRPDDLDLALKLWGDAEVTRLFSKEPWTREQVQQRLEREIANQDHGLQYWPIFNLEDGDFVGCCGLRPYGKDDQTAELGFHLVPKHWGHGFATEAASSTIDYAFSQLGKHAIFAGHHPDNKASRHTLTKLGFIGVSAQYYEPTGLFHPSYLLYRDQPACHIRLAQPNDAIALALVHHTSITKTFGQMLPEYANSRSLDDFEQLWKTRLETPTCVTSAMIRGEQIVGLVSAAASTDDDADGTFGDVDRIYLHPSAWEKGLGVQLLDWCEEELKRMGFQNAKLWVFEMNTRACRFYERNGYQQDGMTKVVFNTRLLRYGKSLK